MKILPDPLKTESHSRYPKEFLWITLGQLLAASGSIYGIRLLTEALPPQVYGEVALAMTIGMLINQVIYGPISVAALRFYSAANEKEQHFFFIKSLLDLNLTIVLSLIPLCLIAILVVNQLEHNDLVIPTVLTVLLAIIMGCNSILDGIQNAARHRAIVAAHQGAGQWLRFLGAIAIIGLFSNTCESALLGFVAASGLILISQILCYLFYSIRPSQPVQVDINITNEWKSALLAYAWPFSIFGIFCWFQIASDRWSLQAFSTPADVGLYTVLYQLGFAPAVLAHGLAVQLIAPIYFSRAGDGSNLSRLKEANLLIKKLLVVTAAVSFAGFFCCYFFHDFIFRLVTPNTYHEISYLLAPMFLAGGFFSAGQSLALLHMGGKDTKALLWPKISTAVAGVVFNVVGAILFGIVGVVWANVAFASSYLVWMYFASAKWIKSSKGALLTPS